MGKDYTPDAPKKYTVSRRNFIKLLAAAGTITAFTAFIDWDKLLFIVRLRISIRYG